MKVTVKADTVYTSTPLTITYKLVIKARVVSITEAITMHIAKNSFFSSPTSSEPFAKAERHYYLGYGNPVLMRKRNFGSMDIFSELPTQTIPGTGNSL